MNIHELIERESNLTFARRGKEYHGPCPFCRCEGNQFVIFPGEGRYWCRQCDMKGDAIQFVRDHKGMSFRQAQEYLGLRNDSGDESIHHNHHNHQNHLFHHNHQEHTHHPPGEAWTAAAQPFVNRCQMDLWGDAGAKALAWLHRRGLNDDTICGAGLGYNMADTYIDRQVWGLAPEEDDKGRAKRLWLPRGIVIPWLVDGALWGVRIRRPIGDLKYYWLPGGTANALYGADALSPGRAAVLAEGEFDALTIQQWAGDLVTAVATGSTHAARRTKWIARLSLASKVLVAYDSDEAGNTAAAYWCDALSNAKRWRPYWSDVNDLAQAGVDVRAWVQAGLPAQAAAKPASTAQHDLVNHSGGTGDAQVQEQCAATVRHLLNQDGEEWSYDDIQPYPAEWLDEQRQEHRAQDVQLRQAAQQMHEQGVRGGHKYRMAIWAGYTSYEAAIIAKMVKTGEWYQTTGGAS